MNITYPFLPKSTAYMLEGQFWDIPLSNGKYACGRVLQFDYSTGKKNSAVFSQDFWIGWEMIHQITSQSLEQNYSLKAMSIFEQYPSTKG